MQETPVRKLRNSLLDPWISLVIVLAIHALGGKNAMAGSVRFTLTILYFAAVLHFIWWFIAPRHDLFYRLYEWRYENAHESLVSLWKSFLEALDQALKVFLIPVFVIVASLALKVLAQWPGLAFLQGLSFLYDKLWLIGLVALIVVLLRFRHVFIAAIQTYVRLRAGQSKLSFTPRSVWQLWSEQSEKKIPSVAPVEGKPYHFLAGGMEWSWDMLYMSCVVFGQPGSGKTICVLNALLDGLLVSASSQECNKPGGLILDPKGDYRDKISRLCERYGRREDLVIFDPYDPNNTLRWNPLDSGDDVQDLGQRLRAVMDVLGMSAGKDSYFVDVAQKFFQHALHLIRITSSPRKPPSFADITLMAQQPGEISRRADLLAHDDPRGDRTLNYFAHEWLAMPADKRNSVLTNLTNVLEPLLVEPFTTALSGRSSFTMRDIVREGRIVYLHIPLAENQVMGRLIGVLMKLAFFKEILKHKEKQRPTFFFCDEFQSFFTTAQGQGDSDFFELSRQSHHANIIASQSLSGLHKQTQQQHHVTSLLGNCATKIFLRNNDKETNDYATELFPVIYADVSGSSSRGGSGLAVANTQQVRAEKANLIEPHKFVGLMRPDPKTEVDYCESIAMLGAHPNPEEPRRMKWKVHPL